MKKQSLIPFTLAICLLVGGGGAWAKTAKADAGKVAPIKTVTQQGMVKGVNLKVNQLTITWKTRGKGLLSKVSTTHKLAVQIKPETQLIFQDAPVQLSDIKTGSTVEIAAQKDHKLWVASRITVLKMKTEAAGKISSPPSK
jgi:hypothetical protein